MPYQGRHHQKPTGGRHRVSAILPPRRLIVTGTVLSAIAFVAVSSSASPLATPATSSVHNPLVDERAILADMQSSRSLVRPTPLATPSATPTKKPSPKPSPSKTKKVIRPVAGLDQKQMNNAATIVAVGQQLGLPKRALIIGVATAMQESSLYNQASEAVPESLNYPHEGDSVDHDSVGIFQQRTSQGWGTVANLMKPAYQSKNFFVRLKEIDWQNMSLTEAAQAVQISAYPDAYAKHEGNATTVVNAILG